MGAEKAAGAHRSLPAGSVGEHLRAPCWRSRLLCQVVSTPLAGLLLGCTAIFLAKKFGKEKANMCPLPAIAVLFYQDEALLPVVIAALQL